MKVPMKYLRSALGTVLLLLLFLPTPIRAYSVLTHEEVVDMAWTQQIVPLLRARYPNITDDDLRQAHAYAYGGSVIQDLGYYPFGSHYFSDLLHYVRTGDFVGALIRDSVTPNEYAFALGALAHYTGDVIGHPAVNLVTADENPKLRQRFGRIVTYAQGPTAHLRTEFGFDVVEVAHGRYSQDNYRDFIGFQVAQPLLERAFQETYSLPVKSILTHEDLAISTYRRTVAGLIPRMTRVALVSYHEQIEKENPGFNRSKFIYRLKRTEYEKQYGKNYIHPGFRDRLVAILLRVFPRVGPFKALQLKVPDAAQQDIYIKSLNHTVDQYKLSLAQVKAPVTEYTPSPPDPNRQPPPPPEQPGEVKVDPASRADTSRTDAEAAAIKAEVVEPRIVNPHTDPGTGRTVTEPQGPPLANTDLDTGKPTAEGEYSLADRTYAHLLADLTAPNAPEVSPGLRVIVLAFYQDPAAQDTLKIKPKDWARVQVNLNTLRTPPPAPTRQAVLGEGESHPLH